MGKYENDEDVPYQCNKDWCKYVADQLENYVDTVNTFLIPIGASKETVDEATKRIGKAIKRLRKGQVSEKDFDLDKLHEFMIKHEA
jgi:hypothetical protein